MAFQRAQWHSGLTYQQTCRSCSKIVEYTDHSLDFRPWYADGFVYCPNCKTPLRHNENYAINAPAPREQETVTAEAVPQSISQEPEVIQVAPVNTGAAAFCTQCGRKSNPGDRFCAACGNKLV